MNKLLILMLILMSSCTYTISMAHTEGTATDVIDETSTPSTTVSPNIQIPKQF